MMSTYTNPIIPGFHPDPSICRVGEDYYLVTSSFEYFPGVPLFHSTNLVDWEQIGHVLTRKEQVPLDGCPPSSGIFASTLRHHNGRFYMVTTNMHGQGRPYGHFYVWTDDIRGEWSDPVRVDLPGFDPDLFFDPSGEVWFTCTNGMSRIDIATGRLIGEPVTRWPGTGGKWSPEAPHIYKINGWYYTMLAEGGTDRGHMVTIARSRALGGPYEECPRNPILTHAGRRSLLQCTGHGDLVQAPDGRWWMVFLAIRLTGSRGHLLGRETCLAPVTWDADGWPVVNGGETIPLSVQVDGLPQPKAPWTEWTDDFSGSSLKPEWTFLRNPNPEHWSLTDPSGALTLRCADVSLDDDASPAWVGRRLQHPRADLRVALEFDPQHEGEEAGLSLYLQSGTHYEVFVTRRGGGRVLLSRRRLGTLCAESEPIPLSPEESSIVLDIRTDENWMDLGYERDGGRVSLARGESGFLTTEVGGQFTGLLVALYATGPRQPRATPSSARFRRFSYSVRP